MRSFLQQSCRAALHPPDLPLRAGRTPARAARAASWPIPPTMAAAAATHGHDIIVASQQTTALCRRPSNPDVTPNDAGRVTVGEKTQLCVQLQAVHGWRLHPQLWRQRGGSQSSGEWGTKPPKGGRWEEQARGWGKQWGHRQSPGPITGRWEGLV